MKSTNTIEINGNLYDAKTGQPLKHKSAAQRTTTPTQTTQKFVDGFHASTQPRKIARKATAKHISVPRAEVKQSAQQLQHTLRHSAPKARTKPKQSVTLHRQAVKRPVISSDAPTQAAATPAVASTALTFSKSSRDNRAQKITKSNAISRFAKKHEAPLPTHVPPTQKQTLTHHLAASHLVKAEVQTEDSSTKEQLIKQAVDKAVLEQKSKKGTKKLKAAHNRTVRYASSAAVFLLLAGYVAYLNVPGISMKVAANRAGFAAALPGYTPGGYSLKTPITAAPGQVTLNFHANTDGRSFTLKQQPTTWDSTALLENFVTKKSPHYLTYQDRGLTIYIYDGSSAAWVNGGKMYSLEGSNSQLDTDQLLKLATSM